MVLKEPGKPLSCGSIERIEDLREQWNKSDILLVPGQGGRRLVAGFACSDRALEAALRLRYSVFNVELGHGSSQAGDGLDRDRFDPQMTHLLLVESGSFRVVGTYRMQTVEQALQGQGIYSAQEYDMVGLAPLFAEAVECGRACIAAEYRKAVSLMILWAGMKAFMTMAGKRWVFGCCSISSHQPDDGWRAMKTIRVSGCLHPEIFLPTTAEYSCGDPRREAAPDLGDPIPLPKLFSAYMRLGAKVISEPAMDRDFGTIDFLVLADGLKVNMAKLGLQPVKVSDTQHGGNL